MPIRHQSCDSCESSPNFPCLFACLLSKNLLIVAIATLSRCQFVINQINPFPLAPVSNTFKGSAVRLKPRLPGLIGKGVKVHQRFHLARPTFWCCLTSLFSLLPSLLIHREPQSRLVRGWVSGPPATHPQPLCRHIWSYIPHKHMWCVKSILGVWG